MKREYLEEALREVSDEHLAEAAVESATKVRNDETVLGVQDVLRSGCGNVESGKKENRTIQHEVEKEEVTGRRTSDWRTSGRTRSGKKKFSWKPVIALVTAAAVLLVVVFGGGQWWNAGESNMSDSVLKAYAVGEAEYPEMSPYPDESQYIKKNGEFDSDSFEKVYDAWWEDQKARRNQPEGYTDGADQFAAVTIPQFLSGAGEENVVYSPSMFTWRCQWRRRSPMAAADSRSWTCWGRTVLRRCGGRHRRSGTPIIVMTRRLPVFWPAPCGWTRALRLIRRRLIVLPTLTMRPPIREICSPRK